MHQVARHRNWKMQRAHGRALAFLVLLSSVFVSPVGAPLGGVPGARGEVRLNLLLRDADSGQPTAARLSLQGPSGWLFASPDPMIVSHFSGVIGPYVHVSDSLSLDLPEGSYTLRASRGITGIPLERSIELQQDETVVLELDHWIDPQAQGWYGADTHIHLRHAGGADYPGLSLEVAAIAARAEGLDLMYLLENDPAHPGGIVLPPWPETTLVWGEEYRNSFWGHTVLLGLDELVTWSGAGCCGTGLPAWPTLRWTFENEERGLALLAHPHTTDEPLRPVAGWPGSGYGREQAALALGDLLHGFSVGSASNAPDEWAMNDYLDALRVGANWAAIGEGDRPLDRYVVSPPGQPRTYAQIGPGWLPGDPSLPTAWEQAVRQGHCYATTGPIIRRFEVDDVAMGETVDLGFPADVAVRLQVDSYSSLTRIALHGATGTHREFNPPPWTSALDTTLIVPIMHDDFVVLEVEAALEEWPGLQFEPKAISSPVWIETATPWPLDAKLVRDKVNELEAFWEQALRDRGFATPTDSAAAWQHIGGAAAAYEALVDDAPADFELLGPSSGEGFSAPPVILSWSSSMSYDAEPLSYRLQVARDPGFSDLVLDEVLVDTLRIITDLEGPASYHWQVEALEPDEPAVLAGGAPRSFVLTGGVVDAPASASFDGALVLARLGTQEDGLRIQLSLRWAMPVQLRWFDARGREIGRRDLGEMVAGVHVLELPARDGRGVRLARGVYWLCAQSGTHQDAVRVLWTR